MKGLIFGNSHVAALLEGWEQDQTLDLDFFAIAGGHGPLIKTVNNRIYAEKSKAIVKSTIEQVSDDGLSLVSYDFVVVCGLSVGAARANFPNHILRTISLARLSTSSSPDYLAVSEAVFEESLLQHQSGFAALSQINAI